MEEKYNGYSRQESMIEFVRIIIISYFRGRGLTINLYRQSPIMSVSEWRPTFATGCLFQNILSVKAGILLLWVLEKEECNLFVNLRQFMT